ncbi:MAG TPA: hypothetical protein DCM05_04535 [Elusimicrobia bacterium]|nr:MAG: hypothetical protein A3J79_13950 [Elusimicrobia bacterium RIFOXYB2_FULL_62_6]HAH05785.1 hypothetical protein [Elusimicrobiota bacterium]
MKISIDRSKCTDCGLCVRMCNLNFVKGTDGRVSAAKPPHTCLLCGHCKAVCPAEAIAHTGLESSSFKRIEGKPSYPELMALLEARRSRREFTPEKLSEEDISALLSAAAQAPNGCNKRNVGYIVVTDPAVLKGLSLGIGEQTLQLAQKLASPFWRPLIDLFFGRQLKEFGPLLPLLKPMAEETLKGNDKVLWKAPCAILLHTSPHDSCGAEDAVYCGANILLAAEALGLGACVLGFLTEPVNRDRKLAKLVRLPKGRVVRTSLCVGHPAFPYSQGVRRPAPDAVRV